MTHSLRQARPIAQHAYYVEPPSALDDGYHLNADLADRDIEFITDLRSVAADRPFVLYYCLGAGRGQHYIERTWIETYRARFDIGWDRWREAVFARQLPMWIVPPSGGCTPARWRCAQHSLSRPTTTSGG